MFTKLGWSLIGEILLLATALLLMSAFALGSFSSAYLLAMLVLAVGVLGFLVYRRVKRRS